MAAQPRPRLTPEQYLEIERASPVRHEYYNGEMYAMAGGSLRQSQIIINIGAELRSALRGRCKVMGQDLRTSVAHEGLYTYPDLVVVCGEPKFADTKPDTVTNPVLVVEVLSPSTEAYDRGFKFAQYRTIETLQEYLMVSQSEPRVEAYRRVANGEWLLTDFAGLDASAVFSSVQVTVPLREIYLDVTFDDPALSVFSGRPAE